jgi:hypothetical protein
MNFNIYVKKGIGDQVARIAKKLHRSRNSIITEALEEWLGKYNNAEWPKHFFDFEPVVDLPDFKAMRSDLKPLDDSDPLA